MPYITIKIRFKNKDLNYLFYKIIIYNYNYLLNYILSRLKC